MSGMRSLSRRLLRRCAGVAMAALHVAAAAGPAEDFAAGKALGNARKGETVEAIKNGRAQQTDPNYNTNPPQKALYGNTNLSGPAAAQQALCATTPNDPSCAGTAQGQAARPRQYITNADPALAGQGAADDPSRILGNIASTYSACASDTTLISPATFAVSSCQINTNAWSSHVCSKTLTVAPRDTFNCTEGQVAAWVGFGWDYRHRRGADLYINGGVVRVYCVPSERTALQMGFFGGDVGEHDAGSGPNFSPPPNPDLLPDLDRTTIPTRVAADLLLPRSQITILGGSGCDRLGDCTYNMKRGNRTFVLAFKQPDFLGLAGDTWANSCEPFEAKAVNAAVPPDGVTLAGAVVLPAVSSVATEQCTRTKSVCVDGPSVKMVDGVPVQRECWKYDNVFDCTSLQATSTCTNPAFGKCSQAGAVNCRLTDSTGHCLSASVDFSCKTAEAVYGPAVNCGAATFCPSGSCYDTSSPPDADFALSVAMLEAGREAGQYLDPMKRKVFVGYDNRCVRKLWGLINCCKGGGTSAASSFNNLSVAASAVGAVGKAAFSTYTYDALFTADAPSVVIQGFEALFGTGFESGLAAVAAGDLSVANFLMEMVPGPWTLAMLAIQFSGLLECPESAQITAMKKDANLCHAVGDYCSKRVLGSCVERTQTYCCFPSRLARIINEQGRAQLGQSWGSAQNPQCGGFTIAELQSLDFSRMDLSEFYAEIVPTLPNLNSLQNGAITKQATCYFGAGKC